jgi:hypothetical protein
VPHQGSSSLDPRRTTCAWVESPLQALSAIEAHAAGQLGRRTLLTARPGIGSLGPTLDHLRGLRLPEGLSIGSADDARRAGRPVDGRTWVVGDGFSGQVQRELALDGSGEIVVVDDGRATLHLLSLLVDGGPLLRAQAQAGPARRLLGHVAGHRLRRAARQRRLTIVTAYDVDPQVRARLEAMGARVRRHRFEWLREQAVPAVPEEATVVLGSAMVEDGLVHPQPYLSWVLARAEEGPVAYYPHRREREVTLDRLRDVPGVSVYRPLLPAELSLRGLTSAHRVVCLPSTTATTLSAVLAGRGTRLVVDPVLEHWWTHRAGTAVRSLLGGHDLAGTTAA